MGKKYQTPTIGGIRKVIQIPSATAAGTTIAELGAKTITLAQLAALLGILPAAGSQTGTIAPGGGAGAPASIVVGPGLTGGGSLLGAVPLGLSAPIPAFVFGGADGEEGSPGPPGINGIIGRDGVQGAAIYMSAEDGEDGWPAIPGSPGPPGAGGSITITDGTNTVAGATSVAFVGATVSGSTPSAIVTVTGGGGGGGIPSTIPDLQLWWESDDILGTSGFSIAKLRERTPWITGALAGPANTATANALAVIDATPLNSLPILNWAATGQVYTINSPFVAGSNGYTIFIVARMSASANRALLGGTSGGIALYIDLSATNKLGLVETAIAVIATATLPWTSGVAFQANASYDNVTGDWEFRQGGAPNGSGTATAGLGTTGAVSWIGADNSAASVNLTNGSIAAIIQYNRVLSPTEKAVMEAYILAKWGV